MMNFVLKTINLIQVTKLFPAIRSGMAAIAQAELADVIHLDSAIGKGEMREKFEVRLQAMQAKAAGQRFMKAAENAGAEGKATAAGSGGTGTSKPKEGAGVEDCEASKGADGRRNAIDAGSSSRTLSLTRIDSEDLEDGGLLKDRHQGDGAPGDEEEEELVSTQATATAT